MKYFFPFISITLLAGIIISGQEKFHTNFDIKTFEIKKETMLERRPISGLSESSDSHGTSQTFEEKFETQKNFESPAYKTGFKFTALGLEWMQQGRDGEVRIFLKYREKGEWSKWILVSPNIDEFGDEIFSTESAGEMNQKFLQKTAFLPMNPSDAFQYQVVLQGNGEKSNSIRNMEVTAISAKGSGADARAKRVQAMIKTQSMSRLFASTGEIPELSTANFQERVKIITRSEWGADESLRIYKSDRPEAQIIPIEGEYLEKFADELTIVRKISTTPDDQPLTWPLQYPDKISKIIIHHTASTANLEDPEQAIRNIYHWHAIGRGWGDIGYNYIIDTQGRIYEGRTGGEGVVGAHAGKSNVGSIGISVLGNYEKSDIPQAAVVSLMQLIDEKAKIHGIDPNGSSMFRGEMSKNILGHRDVMSTSCPGQYIYEKLRTIRNFSAHDLETTQEEKSFKKQKNKGFNYEDHSAIYYLSFDPQKSKTVKIKLKNTGTINWNPKTKLIVKNSAKLNGFIRFEAKPLFQTEITPGNIGLFEVRLTSGVKPKYETLKIAPIINGKTKLEKYLLMPVNVMSPILSYEFVAAKWPKSFLKKGEKISGWVDLKNTGNIAWKNQGDVNIRLGTDRTRDRKSLFLNPPDTRIGFLKQKETPPGSIGRFEFKLKAPEKPGNYEEFLTPVIEGVSWLTDTGMNFKTYVYEKLYNSELLGMSMQNMKPKETKKAWIKVKNTGGKIWSNSPNPQKRSEKNIALEKFGSKTIEIKNIKMLEEKVKPGESATFEFDITAPKKLGKKRLLLRIKLADKFLNKKPFQMEFIVQKKARKKESAQIETQKGGNLVRVLLAGFHPELPQGEGTGAVIIKADKPVKIEIDKNIVAEIPANEKITVKYQVGQAEQGGRYFITSSTFSEAYDGPIRIIPVQPDTVSEIVNYERHPDWNKTLNDNLFRGTLEIRFMENALRIINELPIETYLKGLAEVPNDTLIEKTKAIIVAARTYAYYYSNIGIKFPGKPYHLDDDPEHTQKYRGHGYEKRSPNTVKAVEATKGTLITYNGQPVLTPYFSTSDGRTRSAQELWGWTNTPYLQSVNDPYCKGMKLAGHGVGMSGCGSQGMAENGKTFDDILHYYYQGIVLKKMY